MKQSLLIWCAIICSVLLSGIFLGRGVPTHQGNETSRLAFVESVVDRCTFDISGSCFKTSDHARLPDGRMLSDKPPLLSFAVTGFYAVLKMLTGISFAAHPRAAVWAINFLFTLSAAGVGIAFFFALRNALKRRTCLSYLLFASVMAVCSTLVWSYSVTINNHTLCALVLLLLLGHMNRGGSPVLDGVWTGLLFNLEYVLGGVFGIGVFLYHLCAPAQDRQSRIKRAALYAAGAFAMLGIWVILNRISTGSWLPLYCVTHKPVVRSGNIVPYAWNTLFGFEGFFLYTPALLFLFCVLSKSHAEGRRDSVRTVLLLCCAASAVLFWMGTSDFGGWCYGFRFFVPLAPLMLFYVFQSFRTWRKHSRKFDVFRLALCWGVLTAFVGTQNPWAAGYEGSLTPENNINSHVRNSFLANAMVLSYGISSESPMTRFFMDHVYGRELAVIYMMEEFWNRGDENGFRKLTSEYGNFFGK